MIRRISKVNDLKDIIKSCPSGVIDDITSIKYFIQGHPETEIEAEFEKVGTHLEAILPTSALETLSNGILMRRALYKVEDSSYPDGYYNLEFLDDMNVWLGDEETDDPFDPGYLTEEDLKTINGESLVGVGNIDVVNYIPDYYATKSWVSSNFLSSTALTGYATEQYVYDTAVSFWNSAVPQLYESYVARSNMSSYLSGYATESWVSSQQFATQSWVSAQGYLTSHQDLTGYATESWVSSNYVSTITLSSYTTFSDIDSYISSFWWRAAEEFYNDYVPRREIGSYLSEYATESWVSSQQFATQSWVSGQGYASAADLGSYATESWVLDQGYITSTGLSGLATQSWVLSQNYLNSQSLTGYATESWVSSNYVSTITLSSYTTFSDIDSYISSFWNRAAEEFYYQYVPRSQVESYLSGYATESWVSSQQFATQSWVSAQGYLTSHQDLTGYATESWVLSQNYLNSQSLTGYATESWVSSQQFATQSWVSGQGYLTSVPSEYVTQSWVLSQNYLNSQSLTGYATESWVSSQQFATQSWATSEFLEESKVWTGTQSQWEALTSEQQAGYTIALITE